MFSRYASTWYVVLALAGITLIIVGIIVGCDERKIDTPIFGPAAGSGPIGGGDTQQISLLVNPSETITAVGDEQATAQITALVENNIGQPMPDGTAVYWSATKGTLDSVTTTTSNGSTSVTLTFPMGFLGCSKVTARSGDTSDTIKVCVTNVTPTPTMTQSPTPSPTTTPSKTFIVSADNTTIPHGGTTNINATAMTDGKPDIGLQVNFTVSGGGGVVSPGAAITDSNGTAIVEFTGSNPSTGDKTVTITASSDDGRTGTATVIVTSGATPTPYVPTRTVELNPILDQPCSTTALTVPITAIVKKDSLPEPGVQVVFTSSKPSWVSFSPGTQTTIAGGQATVNLNISASAACPGSTVTELVTITATEQLTGKEGMYTIQITHDP